MAPLPVRRRRSRAVVFAQSPSRPSYVCRVGERPHACSRAMRVAAALSICSSLSARARKTPTAVCGRGGAFARSPIRRQRSRAGGRPLACSRMRRQWLRAGQSRSRQLCVVTASASALVYDGACHSVLAHLAGPPLACALIHPPRAPGSHQGAAIGLISLRPDVSRAPPTPWTPPCQSAAPSLPHPSLAAQPQPGRRRAIEGSSTRYGDNRGRAPRRGGKLARMRPPGLDLPDAISQAQSPGRYRPDTIART